MSAGWFYVALWGVLLTILAVLHFAFDVRALQFGLAIGAAAAVLVLGGLLALRPPRELWERGCAARAPTRTSCPSRTGARARPRAK